MSNRAITAMLAVGVLATAAFVVAGQGTALKAGDAAPKFSAKGSDGKTHSLESLSKGGPFVLYFIKDGCPINDRALPLYNRIAAAYGKEVRFFGVINTGEARFKEWNEGMKVPFITLFDPNQTIISAFRAERSPWKIEVRDGKVATVWPGYSKKELNALNTLLAGLAKKDVAKVDLAAAPDNTRFG